ncbi:MAG: U32 family peptidase [Bacilli bacterium]|nr:U32 family peptidase [Bacilli bacterium]
MRKIELLAPAGDLEKLKYAVIYGADAVYIGGKIFSLRARANNFSMEDIKEACNFAHERNVKVYVTMNIVPHNEDLTELKNYIQELISYNVDAVIVSSLAVMNFINKMFPNLEIHASTQLSVTNSKAIEFLKMLNVKRVVLARELSIEEIKKISLNTDVELEVFIHGGMCTSYSGRCMLSNYMTYRDANRGGCAHSCRWNYQLYSEDKKLLIDDVFNMGSKDLQAIKYIKQLIKYNISSLKIEGRMKSLYYIATVVKSYRNLIDSFYQLGDIISEDEKKCFLEISKAENRELSNGFFEGDVRPNGQLLGVRTEIPTKEFIGIVLDYDNNSKIATIEQRNYFEPNDTIEFFGPKMENQKFVVKEIYDEEGFLLDAARHPRQIIKIKTDISLSKYDLIRKVVLSET